MAAIWRHTAPMIRILLPLALFVPTPAIAQAIQPGNWDVKSTAVDLTIPGAPGFLVRMMKGKSRTEHKCVAPAQAAGGVAALLVPDPKAKCRVESQQIANGRLSQVLLCPQRKGPELRLVRQGSYDANGFNARMTMAGQTPKGPMNIVLDQAARRTAPACRR